jgi:hypothetical protein
MVVQYSRWLLCRQRLLLRDSARRQLECLIAASRPARRARGVRKNALHVKATATSGQRLWIFTPVSTSTTYLLKGPRIWRVGRGDPKPCCYPEDSPELSTSTARQNGATETTPSSLRRVPRLADWCYLPHPLPTPPATNCCSELSTLISARQKLESQQQENLSVQKVRPPTLFSLVASVATLTKCSRNSPPSQTMPTSTSSSAPCS